MIAKWFTAKNYGILLVTYIFAQLGVWYLDSVPPVVVFGPAVLDFAPLLSGTTYNTQVKLLQAYSADGLHVNADGNQLLAVAASARLSGL